MFKIEISLRFIDINNKSWHLLQTLEQPSFKVFLRVEQLLLNSMGKDSIVDEIETFYANFKGDYDPNYLMAELELLPVSSVLCSYLDHF